MDGIPHLQEASFINKDGLKLGHVKVCKSIVFFQISSLIHVVTLWVI